MEVARGRRGARASRLAVALAIAVVARDAWSAPSKDEIEQARRHYARGVELYKQGVDAGALAELERAYALAPNVTILYNIGLVELQLRDFAGALRAFERYLAALQDGRPPSAEATTARRREVEAHVAQLRGQVATMTIDADVEGAELTLDDVVVGASPLDTKVVVNPGHYRVGASAEGREPVSKVVSVAGGDSVDVHLELHRAPEPPPPPMPEPAPEKPPAEVARAPLAAQPVMHEGPPPPSWIGWTVTGTLAAGALATGVAALGADHELSSAKSDGPRSSGDLDTIASRARGLAVASDVLGGAALVAGGVTLYLALKPRGLVPVDATSKAGARLDLGPRGVSVQGRF